VSISRAPGRSVVRSLAPGGTAPPVMPAPALASIATAGPNAPTQQSPQPPPPMGGIGGPAGPAGVRPEWTPARAPIEGGGPGPMAAAPGAARFDGHPAPAPGYADDEAGLSRLPPPLFPRWAIAVTLASLALFVAGLVVYLGREPAASPSPGGDAGPSASAGAAGPDAGAPGRDASSGDGGARGPEVPPGMMLVKDASGAPRLYVDTHPVTAEEFRSVFARHRQKEGRPEVISVSYTEARSYAKTAKGRLLTAAEWDMASTMPGFVVVDGLSEWVESEGGKRVAKKHGEESARKDQEYADVTFRLARDLP
jgi:hypothetical protein